MHNLWQRSRSVAVVVCAVMGLAAVGVVLPVAGSPTAAAAEVNLFAWGDNTYSQLGAGGTTTQTLPQMVTATGALEGKTVTRATMAAQHACAVAEGAAYCWGRNNAGKLGIGNTTDSSVPVAVTGLSGKTVTDISAALDHTCAVADGAAYCWGSGSDGRLGNNSTSNQLTPVAVNTSGVLSGKTVVQVRAANLFTCALTTEPAVYCWGFNSLGSLGNNTTTNSLVPVAVVMNGALAGKTVTHLDTGAGAGGLSACVVASGAAYCWGRNESGQLGNGNTTVSLVPVAVSTSGALLGKTVTDIAVGRFSTCAVANAAAYCWGLNDNYQLGTGNNTDSSSPVAVSTSGALSGKTVVQMSVTDNTACALLSDGGIVCWGSNGVGMFGNGTTGSRLSPTAATTSTGALAGKIVSRIEINYASTIAVTNPPAAVASVSPTSGPAAGGTAVTITGANFSTSGTVSVTVGGAVCASVSVLSASSITCTTGAGTAGTGDVVVTLPDGQTPSKSSAFTYVAAPTLAGATPSGRPPTSGGSVTIAGSGFAMSGSVGVTIGGNACGSVSVASTTVLTCVAPTGTLGAAEVVVTNPDGQSASNSSIFAYAPAPSATAVSPAVGGLAGGTQVAIAGTDFATSGSVSVTVAGAVCGSVQASANSLTCVTPSASAGTADIVVTNPDGQSSTLTNGFTFVPLPGVVSITPDTGPAAGGTTLTLSGSDFDASVVVTVAGKPCPISVTSKSSITCTTPSGSPGAADVVVTNPAAQSRTVTGGFTYVARPGVLSVSPSSGPWSGGTTIAIAGHDFATSGTVDVTVGGVACGAIAVKSSSSIECVTPAGSVGSANVVVTNPDGQTDTSVAGYAYVQTLAISDVSPRSARSIGGTTLTITGAGFATSGSVGVTVGGAPCTSVSVSSATSLTCVTPAGTVGSTTIEVINPDRQSTSSSLFTYVATTASTVRYTGPIRITQSTSTIDVSAQVGTSSCWAGRITFHHDAAGNGSYTALVGSATVDPATGLATVRWTLPTPRSGSLIGIRASFDGGIACQSATSTAVIAVPPSTAPSVGAAVYSVPGVQRIGMAYVVDNSTSGEIAWEVPGSTRVVGQLTRYEVNACPDQKPPVTKTAICASMWGSGTLSDWDPVGSTWVQRASSVAFRVWVADGGFNIVKGAPAQPRADWFRFDATSVDLIGETKTLTSIGSDYLAIR